MKGIFCMMILFQILGYGCKTERPPNIVFILVDDLGWSDLGCYGSEFYETPNIDKLAAQGMLFKQAYSANPVCSPTRASIMTGKYPTRVGITDWIPGLDPKNRKLLGPEDLHALPLEENTLAESLKEHGYHTFFAGKWHLGGEGYYPEDQGFDINIGGHDKGSPPGGYYAPYNNPKLADGPEGEYLTDRLTNESLNFMEANAGDPFFLFLSFYTVHTPIEANRQYVPKFREKLRLLGDTAIRQVREHEGLTVIDQLNPDYASMVYAMDQNVGRLLNKLDQLRLTDHTLVIFTSDNGGLSTLPRDGMTAPTSVRPLRAGKGWCYEGGIRVPLLIRMPGRVTPNIQSQVPVISCDFYPTIMEIAGIPEEADPPHLDGTSLVPILKGKGNWAREVLFWHYPHYHGSAWTPGAAIRWNDWKMIEYYEWDKTELYNLKDDPEETIDLAADNPDLVNELRSKLRQKQEETSANFPLKNPDFKQ